MTKVKHTSVSKTGRAKSGKRRIPPSNGKRLKEGSPKEVPGTPVCPDRTAVRAESSLYPQG
jgi:hypothetical protein